MYTSINIQIKLRGAPQHNSASSVGRYPSSAVRVLCAACCVLCAGTRFRNGFGSDYRWSLIRVTVPISVTTTHRSRRTELIK